MNKSKIEWCDRTWNPVTGCLHGCPYCYAEKIAKRFGKPGDDTLHDLKSPELVTSTKEISAAMEPLEVYAEYRVCPYPYGFAPTFHRYKLERPQKVKEPQNVFVCSMADLFGEWVPDEWIDKVFDVCNGAPQHRFLFLTKNPKRYMELYNVLPRSNNFFFGTTVTTKDTEYWYSGRHNWFLSIEPIMSKFTGRGISGHMPMWEGPGLKPMWVIIGAETGNRKGRVVPKREWIEILVDVCRKENIPVFLKNSLAPVWGEPLIQEYPWEKG
jgi:protein gp37